MAFRLGKKRKWKEGGAESGNMRESGLFKRKKRLKEQHELKGRKLPHHMSCNELYSKCQLLYKSQHRREPVYLHARQEVVCQTVVKKRLFSRYCGKASFPFQFSSFAFTVHDKAPFSCAGPPPTIFISHQMQMRSPWDGKSSCSRFWIRHFKKKQFWFLRQKLERPFDMHSNAVMVFLLEKEGQGWSKVTCGHESPFKSSWSIKFLSHIIKVS